MRGWGSFRFYLHGGGPKRRRRGSNAVQRLDFSAPEAAAANLQRGRPARRKAVSAGQKQSGKLDARTLADLLRANLFPACYGKPPELEGLRRHRRFWHMVVGGKGAF